MNNYHHRLIPEDKSPALILLMLLSSLAVGFFIGAFFASLTAIPFIGDFKEVADIMGNREPSNWWAIMIMQVTSAATLFILTPILFIKYVLKTNIKSLFAHNNKFLVATGITIAATLSFMFVNTLLIDWNSRLVLPESMKGIEDYILSKEQSLSELTVFLTTFTGLDKYLLTLFAIAIVPAIGEEILFRGLLQTLFEKYIKNVHLAIILTAILFSAFHIQFYGFLPRMALGVFFGYLFYYSGNIIYPMIAHFINNGLTITLIYLYNTKLIEFNIENQEAPSTIFIIVFLVIGILLMFTFIRLFQNKKSKIASWQKVFSDELVYRAEMVKAVLADNDIDSVILNKRDTNYHWGSHDVMVAADDILKAIKIIKEEINFE